MHYYYIINIRLVLEEVKFLQKQREKKSGLPAVIPAAGGGGHQQSNNGGGGLVSKAMVDKNNNNINNEGGGDAEKDELVLQDTFAQETAVMVEDPNMYVKVKLPSSSSSSLVMHFFFYTFSSFFLNFITSHPMLLNEIR